MLTFLPITSCGLATSICQENTLAIMYSTTLRFLFTCDVVAYLDSTTCLPSKLCNNEKRKYNIHLPKSRHDGNQTPARA